MPIFTEVQLAGYLQRQGRSIVEFRGRLWRNAAAPSPIAGRDWTPVNRWDPLTADEVGFPCRSALAYRSIAAGGGSGTFPFVVFRDVQGYDEKRLTRHRARQVRVALGRYNYQVLDAPDLLLEQGWGVAAPAAKASGMRLPPDEVAYRRRIVAAFEGVPPVVWAATNGRQLAAYAVTYATGAQAMFESIYIGPPYRDSAVGLGLYWHLVTGWSVTPGIENLWTGGTLPQRGVNQFKISMGATLEDVPVHAGMRWPVRAALRRVKPNAVSLGGLS